VITTKSKYRDQAGAFIKFISNQENSQFWFDKDQQMPARKSILNNAALYQKLPNKLFQETLLNWGVARPQTPGFTEYDQVVTTMFDNIGKGASVSDTVKDAVTKVDQALAKYAG
jgi:maltose-binding protein MalE